MTGGSSQVEKSAEHKSQRRVQDQPANLIATTAVVVVAIVVVTTAAAATARPVAATATPVVGLGGNAAGAW